MPAGAAGDRHALERSVSPHTHTVWGGKSLPAVPSRARQLRPVYTVYTVVKQAVRRQVGQATMARDWSPGVLKPRCFNVSVLNAPHTQTHTRDSLPGARVGQASARDRHVLPSHCYVTGRRHIIGQSRPRAAPLTDSTSFRGLSPLPSADPHTAELRYPPAVSLAVHSVSFPLPRHTAKRSVDSTSSTRVFSPSAAVLAVYHSVRWSAFSPRWYRSQSRSSSRSRLTAYLLQLNSGRDMRASHTLERIDFRLGSTGQGVRYGTN